MDCRGVYLGPALAARLECSKHHHLLDIAGGSGIYACAIVARHPHLRGTVLEKSPVDRITQKLLAERVAPPPVTGAFPAPASEATTPGSAGIPPGETVGRGTRRQGCQRSQEIHGGNYLEGVAIHNLRASRKGAQIVRRRSPRTARA